MVAYTTTFSYLQLSSYSIFFLATLMYIALLIFLLYVKDVMVEAVWLILF